jgi:hypothetical protein
MAGRREQTVESDGDALILPRHLADRPPSGRSAEEYREHNLERNAWFSEHGINPGDWNRCTRS